MIKIYQAMYDKNLYVSVYIDGVEYRVGFTGADAKNNGVYHTSDPIMQHELERSNMYNRLYKLKSALGLKKSPLVGPGLVIEGPVTSENLKRNGLLAGQKAVEAAPLIKEDSIAEDAPAEELETGELKVEELEAEEQPLGDTDLSVRSKVEEIEPEDESFNKEEIDAVAFRNLSEAQDYFGKAPFNIAKSNLRSSDSVMKVAAQFGVNVVFERK